MCRQHVAYDQVKYVLNNDEAGGGASFSSANEEKKEDQRVILSKPDTVLKIVKSDAEKQFIIFSNHDETFQTLQRIFKEHSIEIKQIKGRSSFRNDNLLKFRQGHYKIIFLNSQYNGSGINLENATDIILYHEIDDDLTKQIIGRAQRIGRKRDLVVHTLV